MSNPIGPIDREDYSTSQERSTPKTLPDFIAEAFSWLAGSIGSYFTRDRHLKVISRAPLLIDLPQIEEKPVIHLSSSSEKLVSLLASTAGLAASISSSRKDEQIAIIKNVLAEILSQSVNGQLMALASLNKREVDIQREVDIHTGKPLVHKLSQRVEKALIEQLLPLPVYTQDQDVERIVSQAAKPILDVILKELEAVDEVGEIRGVIDRFVAQLDLHVTALRKSGFKFQSFQEQQGCHPLLRTIKRKSFNDPEFKNDLKNELEKHLDYLVGLLLGKEARERIFRELYKTRQEWLPRQVDDQALELLIRDENNFVKISEWAFDFYLNKYKPIILDSLVENVLQFTQTAFVKKLVIDNLVSTILDIVNTQAPVEQENRPLPSVTPPPVIQKEVEGSRAYGHLANQLIFGVLIGSRHELSFISSLWEGILNSQIESSLSFIRDDKSPLNKLLDLLLPGLEKTLSRKNLYKMLTAPPISAANEPTEKEQLQTLAKALLKLMKGSTVASVLMPSEELLTKLLEDRINLLFKGQWKTINLVLMLLDGMPREGYQKRS